MGRVLAKDRVYDLLLDNAKYDDKLETHYAVVKQKEIAETLDIVPMTVNRSVKKLKEEGKIDYMSKSGRHQSGHIVTFKTGDTNPDNPLTGTTVKAKKVYEAYFEPEVYTPKKKYRTKAQIAEDELKKTELQKSYDRMNDELEGHSFVPKAFFRKMDNSNIAYKGYMLSRLYNAMLVTYTEDWKNLAEKAENEHWYRRANQFYNKYKNYDIIGKRFMGTTTFKKFAELGIILESLDIDPADYLSVHFNRMFYRLKRGQGANPPHINNLTSEGGLLIYDQQVDYKRDFERKHPYYAKPGKIRRSYGDYPIIEALKEEFRRGLDGDMNYYRDTFSRETLEEDLNMLKEFNLYGLPEEDSMVLLYDDIRNDKNYNELTEEEKLNLTKYIDRNIGIFKDRVRVTSEYLKYYTPTIRYLVDEEYNSTDKVNRRERFARIGNFKQEKDISILEGQKFIKYGYKLYFSMRGSRTFLPAIYTMRDERHADLDYNQVKSALNKLETNVPINDTGLIDINVLVDELAENNAMIRDSIEKNKRYKIKDTVEFFLENEVDNKEAFWYEIYEPQGKLGKNPRDGNLK